MTVGQAAARYLGALPTEQRERAAPEINRLVRHLGAHKLLAQVTKTDVDRYQQALIDSGVPAAARVEPLKAFLADAKAKKLTDVNLGAVLRVRRRSGGQGKHEEAEMIELTQEGLDQLKAELSRLETEEVPHARAALEAAFQDRDFRENAPYDEAKRHMGALQGQIDRLKNQIKAARVVQRQNSTDRVGLGSKVVLHDKQFDEEIAYTIVGPGEVDTRNYKISIQSPVGSALKDCSVGEEVEIEIPSGRAHYKIVRIERAD